MWRRGGLSPRLRAHLRSAHGGRSRARLALPRAFALQRSYSSALTAPRFTETEWSLASVKSVLEQAADEGTLPEALHAKLHGRPAPSEDVLEDDAEVSDALVDEGTEPAVTCSLQDYVLTIELCRSRRLRDFVLLARLADRLVPEVHKAPVSVLVQLGALYASLGALNTPLFEALARALLAAWPSPASSKASEVPDALQLVPDVVQVARAFAAQRFRHEELFDRLVLILSANGLDSTTPDQAMSFLHSMAFLRLGGEYDALWEQLERTVAPSGFTSIGLRPASELCHVLFLARRTDTRLQDVSELLEALAGPVLAMQDADWSGSQGAALHRRLLLLRSAMRYLHRDAYQALPSIVAQALRRVHRMEPPQRAVRPAVSFVRKLSHVLTKIKVGHLCNAERGPLVLDVVERDRKLIYECNHFDRFYVGTTEKIASASLQERIVKAMGYRVVQIPHWQWSKLRHKKQRIEYVRMSRYYAIKDRREFEPRDEAPKDIAVNEFDHMGEYFFRKEMPSSSWAWFQPRYDASKRLPQDSPRVVTSR